MYLKNLKLYQKSVIIPLQFNIIQPDNGNYGIKSNKGHNDQCQKSEKTWKNIKYSQINQNEQWKEYENR